MKNLVLYIIIGLMSAGLTGCGDDSKSTSTGGNKNNRNGFPTYSDKAECSDSYLNPTVTTDYGRVSVGIPGNEDCPYKKSVTREFFVEAYTMITSSRNSRSEGFYGVNFNFNCDLRGCWSYQLQCPPGFQRIRQRRSQPLFYANFDAYYGSHRNSNRGYQNRNNNRRSSIYDNLDSQRNWCEPVYGSRWYDDWAEEIDFGEYL